VPPVKASSNDEGIVALTLGTTSEFAGRLMLALLYKVLLNIMVRMVKFVWTVRTAVSRA